MGPKSMSLEVEAVGSALEVEGAEVPGWGFWWVSPGGMTLKG